MHIYVDESGNFRRLSEKADQVSCLGGLVLPTEHREEIFSRYASLRKTLGISGHVTGGRLTAEQVDAVVRLLLPYEPLLIVHAIEMAHHPDDVIRRRKELQAEAFVANITRDFSPLVVQEMCNLRDAYRRLPDQLFVQAEITNSLIEKILRTVIIYYALRSPSELSEFHWIIDTKRDHRYEELWSLTILPALDWRLSKKPLGFLKGCDYSGFSRFTVPGSDPPKHDLKMIWTENLLFLDSEADLGLELVHILTNATRRALRGRLGYLGWHRLGELMLRRNPQTVTLLNLGAESSSSTDLPTQYERVIRQVERTARSMWPKEHNMGEAEQKTPEISIEYARQQVEKIEKSLPQGFDISTLGFPSPIPFKVVTLREVLLHRLSELARSAVDLISAERPVAAVILTRGVMETTATLFAVKLLIDESLERREVSGADNTVMRLLFGGRNERASQRAINVQDHLEKMDETFAGIKNWYDDLSDIADPNFPGLMGSYAAIDRSRFRVQLGPNPEWDEMGVRVALPALCACLEIAIHLYNGMKSPLERFVAMCQDLAKSSGET